MTTRSKKKRVPEMTWEEGYALLDLEAHRYLNMSADEFIRKFNAGEFDDPDDKPGVMSVAMLLPFVRGYTPA